MPAGPPRLYPINDFFLIARACLEDEEPGSDITGSAGHVADPYKSAVKHLALHKRGAASAEQAPAAAVAFPRPGEEQGGTRAEPAPTGHRGHRVPAAKRAAEAGGSPWRRGGKGSQCQRGMGSGEEGPCAGVAAPAPFGGGLIQAAHAATGMGSQDNAVPTWPQLCFSIRRAMPRMTLIPDMVGGHSRVWGPWVQRAHPGGF